MNWRRRVAQWLDPQRSAAAGPFQPIAPSHRAISDFALNWGRSGVPVNGETATRMYNGAKGGNLVAGFGGTNSSADAELHTSLRELRSRSRQLVRDAAYAKRMRTLVVNNVVGSGIGMQAQVMTSRDELNERVNADIEAAWHEWCRGTNCHTGGALHFCDLERAVIGQVFEAGEVILRKHYRAFGDSSIPFALELIEAERIADDFVQNVPPTAQTPGAFVRMGVEVDRFGRPLAYLIRERHPGELRLQGASPERIERVPADQIIHLKVTDRWPQTRGEPWLHAVIRKLNDMDGYSEAELVAARGAACYMFAVETPDLESPQGDGDNDEPRTSEDLIEMEPGMGRKLLPGEKLNFISPNRPNVAMDPFMRMMLREAAAGGNVSYESLSRDGSQSNYSSTRIQLLDDRDVWRALQSWFLRAFRHELHREWMRIAVYSRAIRSIPVEQFVADPLKFEAVRFKPRGWSWIDPTKEVEAFERAVRNGFTTVSDVIAQTAEGRDIEDVITQRDRELKMMHDKGLVFDTDPGVGAPADALAKVKAASQPAEPQMNDDDDEVNEDERPSRVIPMGSKR